MRYYPINLDLHRKRVAVVGGGAVAARKAKRLVAAGALVVVIAPNAHDTIVALAATESITYLKRRYLSGDLDGALLAFAATDDAAVNAAVAAEARERGILIDVVDNPKQSDFTTPATLERGDFLVTVSTGGASPALSRRVMADLEGQYGAEYGEAVALLGAVREKLLTVKGRNAYNERVFAELAALDLPALIRNGQRDAIDRILLKLSFSEKKDPS